ncbi:VanW family protein [Deinococcus sp.]|uniref:VanW family protein n=1 Tax=Deinococcus sp. TaxID=47478 RepID=UPI0025D5DAEE|nr:VanW family protein [Deinococcus sp.]
MKPWIISLAALGVLGGALALGVAANEGSLPAQTSVGDIDVSGLDQVAAVAKVRAGLARSPQIDVSAGPRHWLLSADKLGYAVDAERSVAAAFTEAHNRSLVEKVEDLAGQSPAMSFPLKVSLDAAVARKALSALTSDLNTAPRNGKIIFGNARYSVTPDSPGQKIDVEAAATALAADPSLRAVALELTTWDAENTAAELQLLADRGNALLRPLSVQLGDSGHTGVLSAVQVANLFWIRAGGLELDEAALKGTLKSLSGYLDQPAQNARYQAQGAGLIRVREQVGLMTDQVSALKVLGAAVLDPLVRSVTLPSKVAQPAITVAALPDPSKLSLITTGVSTYYHSSPARRSNVANAAAKIDGAVIAPGGVFSFLSTLGGISAGNGFVSGLIISGGRTVDGLGGGVCQVSTTTFRALYQSGMPIVERNQHSYRVGYYEPRVGFEAAVYDPGVDLKMKNDTGGPVLIRTVNRNARSTLEVQIWGLPQRRTVSVSRATILASTPHPAPKYVVNPKLPRGAFKQVDWAADGFNLFITRTIRDAGTVRSDQVKTIYKPWQAVFERGPS